MRIRVQLAADHAAIRAGLRSLLEAEDGIEVVAEAADGFEVVAAAPEEAPDVVLIDVASAEPEQLVAAVRELGGAGPAVAIHRLSPSVDELTAREVEVLASLARGLSNAEIASSLRVSETTVKTHVARILMKLDLRDRVQAVVFAYESGLVQPGAGADSPRRPASHARASSSTPG